MRTPKEFLERVAQILGAESPEGRIDIEFRWDSRDEAKVALNRTTIMLRDLRLLRHELSLGTTELRHLYSQKLAHIDQLASEDDQSSYLYSRSMSSQIDADMRRTVRVERSDALAPYLGVSRTLAAVDLQIRTIQNQIRTSPEYLSTSSGAKTSPPAIGHQYFVRIDSERKGPLSAEQVRGLIKIGLLSSEDEVQVKGIDSWIPISKVGELGDG